MANAFHYKSQSKPSTASARTFVPIRGACPASTSWLEPVLWTILRRKRLIMLADHYLNLGPYHHPPGQSAAHTLPGLAELSQGHAGPHQPPAYGPHAPPSHNPGHSLPGIGQAMRHPSPQPMNRERERDPREQELIERQRQQEELAHREREQREREQLERQQLERQREQQHHPVQSHTGSIPLHQPVASKVPNSIHGPNGLLSNLGGNPANAQGSVQSSGGLGGIYGSQVQPGEGTPRPYMQHAPGGPGQPMLGYNSSGPQIPGSVAALAQGQQPILNVGLPTVSLCDFLRWRFCLLIRQPARTH